MAGQLDVPALRFSWLAATTLAALLAALLGRRRLPIGMSDGLFVGAISGVALLTHMTLHGMAGPLLLGINLATLSLLWFVVAVWVERPPVHGGEASDASHGAGLGTPPVAPAAADRPAVEASRRYVVRQSLAAHVSAIAGLTALGLFEAPNGPTGRAGEFLVAGILLIPAAGFYFWQRHVLARYATVGLVLLIVARATEPLWRTAAAAPVRSSLGLLAAAVVTLLVVIASLLLDWRSRSGAAWEDPRQLLEPPPTHRRLYGLVLAAGALIAMGGLLLRTGMATPAAIGLAAIAAATVGHRWRSNAVGEFALVLAAATAFTAGTAWLPARTLGPLIGCTLAGLWMLWLARFWHQQLNDGRPWTTAGRMIPAARHLGYALAGGVFLLAVGLVAQGTRPGPGRIESLFAALLLLMYWSLLLRDAASQRSSIGALAGCAMLVAALVPVHHLLQATALAVPPFALLAVAALALGIRTGGRQPPEVRWPCNAYVGGFLLLGTVWTFVPPSGASYAPVTITLAAVAVAAGIASRWASDRRSAACSETATSYNGAPSDPPAE